MKLDAHRHYPLGIHLDVANRLWQRAMEVRAGAINRPHWLVLSAIDELGDGCTLTQITGFLCMELSTCSRAVVWLARQKLIQRLEDPRDKRAKVIHITPAGQRRLLELDAVAEQVREQMLVDISSQQRIQFQQVLDAIQHRAAELLSDHASQDGTTRHEPHCMSSKQASSKQATPQQVLGRADTGADPGA